MSNVTLKINGQAVTVDVPSDMPLLWALRDKLDLTGTKYSCGIGVCGSCTVLVNGVPMRSCVMPAVSMAGMEIITRAWIPPVSIPYRKRGMKKMFRSVDTVRPVKS